MASDKPFWKTISPPTHDIIQTVRRLYYHYVRGHATGLKKQVPDPRDYILETNESGSLPREVYNTESLGPVRDQGRTNACTGYAIGALLQHYLSSETGVPQSVLDVSERYQWWIHRVYEGNEGRNVGCYLRKGFKALHRDGFVGEKYYPNKSSPSRHPSRRAELAGKLSAKWLVSRLGGYYKVRKEDILQALADGHVVVFGMFIDSNFYNVGKGDVISTYDSSKKAGAHAMLVCGYRTNDDGSVDLYIRNSWGARWGEGGYGWLALDLFKKSYTRGGAFDLWTLE